MTTQYQIEISKNFPLSTQAALACANERRQELEADIQKFLDKGSKVQVISKPIVNRQPIEKMVDFNGGTKETSEWAELKRLSMLMKKHNLKQAHVARLAGINQPMLCNYLNGKINPRPPTRQKIESVINSLCKSEA